jgi:HK97 family phage major capsid protein
MVSYLMPMLYKRLELARDAAAATAIISGATAATFTTGSTSSSTTAISYQDVLDFEHSISPQHRSDAVIICSDSWMKLVRSVVDDNHRPLLELSPQTMISSIHGIPIFISDNFEAFSADNVPAVIASAECLKLYYAGPQRLARFVNVPTRPDQTGYELFENGDFDFVSAGVRKWVTKYS